MSTKGMEFAVFSHIAEKAKSSINTRLKEFTYEVRLAEELGYDYFFTTEHHFSGRFSLSPSQAVSLAVIAQNSSRMRFGPMVVQLPISQPLRVVEEMLILDHMSGGRLEIGLGRGITPHEHTSYGIPTKTDYARFKEGLEFVVKALTTEGRFSWVGEYYQYFDIDLPWGPFQKPRPPIWIPTNTAATAYEYGKQGYGVGAFAVVGPDHFTKVFDEYRRGCDEMSIPIDQRRVSYLASTFVAETDAEAEALMFDHFARQLALFRYERERSYEVVDSEMRKSIRSSLARLDAIASNLPEMSEGLRFVCGSPSTVAGKIQELRERLGVNVFIGEFSFGELDWADVERSHRLFATEVIPAVHYFESRSSKVMV